MEDSNRLSYFLLGAGLGAVVAMIFAPKSGAETRNYLQTKSRETADTLRRKGEDLRDRTVETLERSKQGVRDQLETVSAAFDAGKKAFKEAAEPHVHS